MITHGRTLKKIISKYIRNPLFLTFKWMKLMMDLMTEKLKDPQTVKTRHP